MKYLVVFLLVAVSTLGFGQTTEQRNVSGFTGIKVSEGIDVYLKQGDKEEVTVSITGNTKPENVITEVSGSYLKIHRRSGDRGWDNATAKVYVTYIKLNKLSASSAGNIFAEGPIKSSDLELQCSSAGTIEVALESGSVTVDVSSAGQVELNGKVRTFFAEASSAGQIDAYDLTVEEAEATASSAASIKINVISSLKADASSGAVIRYRGNPGKSFTNSSSGGSVKKSG